MVQCLGFIVTALGYPRREGDDSLSSDIGILTRKPEVPNPATTTLNWGFPELGIQFGGTKRKGYSILDIQGSPYDGKLPNHV